MFTLIGRAAVALAAAALAVTAAAPAQAATSGTYVTSISDNWHTPPLLLAMASGNVTYSDISSSSGRPRRFTASLDLFRGASNTSSVSAQFCWYNNDSQNTDGGLVGCGPWRYGGNAGTHAKWSGLTASSTWGITLVCVTLHDGNGEVADDCVNFWY